MNVFNTHTRPSNRVLNAFVGIPQRRLLPPGTRLYRFETLLSKLDPKFREQKSTFEREWWFPQSTLHQLCRSARASHRSLKAQARPGLAVGVEWSPTMDWLAIIELKCFGYGWIGPARNQPARLADLSHWLPGGGIQAWVPGLAGNGDGVNSPYAMFLYYGSGAVAERM